MIRWDTCKEDFQWDGSWRDIYVTPATLADWRVLLSLLCAYPGVEYFVDGVAQPIPGAVDQVFTVRALASPMLRIRVGRANVVFHFFAADEIECDVDPREITSQADLDALLNFIRQVGDAIHKPVVMTPENLQVQPFITYDPESRDFKYRKVAVKPCNFANRVGELESLSHANDTHHSSWPRLGRLCLQSQAGPEQAGLG